MKSLKRFHFLTFVLVFFLSLGTLLGQDLAALKEQEAKLKGEEFQLAEAGLSAQDLMNHLQKLKNGTEKKDEFTAYLQDWYGKHKIFHEHTDEFTINQLDYFIEHTDEEIKSTVGKVLSKIEDETTIIYPQIKEQLQKLDLRKKEYFDNKKEYGKGKDKDRMNAYRSYFSHARRLVKEIAKIMKQEQLTRFSCPQSKSFLDNLGPVGSVVKNANLIWPGLKLVKEIVFKSNNPVNSTPLVDTFEDFQQVYGQNLGYEVELKGEENIPAYTPMDESKKVTIFAVSHRDEEADSVAITHLGNKKKFPHLIFFAAYNVLPTWLAKIADNSNEVLVVGGDEKIRKYKTPLDKLMEKLDQKVSSSFVIFPQGSVTIINEVHPLREKTTWESLVSAGHQVEIVPISLDVDARFLSHSGDVDNKKVIVQVNPKIDFASYQSLIAGTGGDVQVINHLLRSLWIEQIKENGPLSVQEMDKRIQDKILGPLHKLSE